MSVQVKSLTTVGPPTLDNSSVAPNDNFNIIPMANMVYDLYAAKNDTTNQIYKTAIVKNIRLVNTSGSAVTVNLYFMRLNSNGQNRRRSISPVNLSLLAGYLYVDDDEITLEPGDRIQCMVSVAGVVQYLISGVERDA